MVKGIFSFLTVVIAMLLFFNAGGLYEADRSLRNQQTDLMTVFYGNLGWQSTALMLTFAATLVVFVLFVRKFDGWPMGTSGPEGYPAESPPQYFTTRFRFRAWAFLYGGLMALAFLMLVFFPKLVDNALSLLLPLMTTNSFLSDVDKILNRQFVATGNPWTLSAATLIMTAFYRSDWERMLRTSFQNYALIPKQAEHVFDTLRLNLTRDAPPRELQQKFLNAFQMDDSLPRYFEVDLNPDVDQTAQNRLERLGRLEFMLWWVDSGQLPSEVRARVREHSQLLTDLSKRVADIRNTAVTLAEQVLEIGNILLDVSTEENSQALARKLADASGRPLFNGRMSDLPISRIDDVIPIIHEELALIGKPQSGGSRNSGPVLLLVEEHSAATRAIERLEGQITSLRALVPFCAKGLNNLNERVRDLSEKLHTVVDDCLRFFICIGLAAPHTSSKRFFEGLGLEPQLGREFNMRWGLGLGLLLASAFVLVVAYIATGNTLTFSGSANVMQANNATPMILEGEDTLWFAIGVPYLLWPFIHGSYLGSSLVFQKHELESTAQSQSIHLIDYFVSFIKIWSLLVIGVTFLLYVTRLGYDAPSVYAGALAFSPLPALWGTIVTVVSYRMISPQTKGSCLKWPELLFSLCVVVPLLILSWRLAETFGIDAPTPEKRKFVIAFGFTLTVSILVLLLAGSSSVLSDAKTWFERRGQQLMARLSTGEKKTAATSATITTLVLKPGRPEFASKRSRV